LRTATHPRGAADRSQYRQAAGLGKALKLWRNDPTAYPFYSNNVMAITRVLFQSRHAWFCPHQYRYCVDDCGGAVLGMSVAFGEIISRSAAKLFSKDKALRIAANIAKLPELLDRS
jgi:hypothetical protein